MTNISTNGWLVLNTTNCSITLSNLQTSDSATYRVIVTNSVSPLLLVSTSVVPDENAGRHIEGAVIGVELLDCRTTAGDVAFTENLLEVAV